MFLLRTRPRALDAAALLVALLAACFGAQSASAAAHFHEFSPDANASSLYPTSSRFFTAELTDLRAVLAGAPVEDFSRPVAGLVLSLPLPDGTDERFEIWESSVMHPALAAKYPEIKTYFGRGIDDRTATARLDATPHGFHAMVLSTRPVMFIDPFERGNTAVYVSHFERPRDAEFSAEPFTCELVTTPEAEREMEELLRGHDGQGVLAVTGPQLRTYRTAIAATREYTTYHGGTVPLGLAAINTSLNRVNGVYEREVAVRMELIPNNDLIVYTAEPDPYTNSDGGTMLAQNQSNLDLTIGTANYDMGHVFSTGGGGIAGLSVVCKVGQKARGVTGSGAPIGDNFDIDYVAHEMGHQFGATHSFNGSSGQCAANRTASTAYEPGSGTTIMSYAGICAGQNIQPHSDADFHGKSFDQICLYTQTGMGSGCPVVTNTGNTPPTADAGNVGLTIPKQTPFILYGVADDVDGDAITYSWEEFDLGPAGHPNSPSGNAPIFRSFTPKTEEWRMFPKKSDVRNNTQTMGEILPSYARTLHFRLTVRDGLGGVSNDTTSVAVADSAGPFLVTSIDTTPWDFGNSKTITWDVAGTDLAPVSCAEVNILLSTDNGVTFPIVLAAATPNDGSEVIAVPGLMVATSLGRVQIEGVGNVFFDWNNASFVINVGPVGVGEIAQAEERVLELHPNPFTNRTSVSFAVTRPGPVSLRVFDVSGRLVSTLVNAPREAGWQTVDWNGLDSTGRAASAGVYFVRLETSGESRTVRSLRLK